MSQFRPTKTYCLKCIPLCVQCHINQFSHRKWWKTKTNEFQSCDMCILWFIAVDANLKIVTADRSLIMFGKSSLIDAWLSRKSYVAKSVFLIILQMTANAMWKLLIVIIIKNKLLTIYLPTKHSIHRDMQAIFLDSSVYNRIISRKFVMHGHMCVRGLVCMSA